MSRPRKQIRGAESSTNRGASTLRTTKSGPSPRNGPAPGGAQGRMQGAHAPLRAKLAAAQHALYADEDGSLSGVSRLALQEAVSNFLEECRVQLGPGAFAGSSSTLQSRSWIAEVSRSRQAEDKKRQIRSERRRRDYNDVAKRLGR